MQSAHAATRTRSKGKVNFKKHTAASRRKSQLRKYKSLKWSTDVKPFQGLVSDVQCPPRRLKTYF